MTKIALITGATSGIGAAFARELAAQGCNLGLVGRRTELLKTLADELASKHGIQAEAITADLATEAGQQLTVAWIRAHSPLNLLINNAGFGVKGSFAETSTAAHIEMLAVHTAAPVWLTGAALPAMIQAGQGTIINVSSPAAYMPARGNTSYSATKAFLNIFSEALHTELRGKGITIQVLLPGFTYSDFHKRGEWGKKDFYSTLPRWMWMTSEAVAQTSLRALKRGNLYCIPGLHNKVLVFLGRIGLVSWLGRSRWIKRGLDAR
jgi:short-subunit dehydrogenase